MGTALRNIIQKLKTLDECAGDDAQPECVVILSVNATKDATQQPITQFTYGDQKIDRNPDETFEAFESRAREAAMKDQPPVTPGVARSIPVLIGLPGEDAA